MNDILINVLFVIMGAVSALLIAFGMIMIIDGLAS